MFRIKKILALLLLTSSITALFAMQKSSELYSFTPVVQQFPQTNWLALQELNTLYEGRLPVFYQTPLMNHQLTLPAIQSSSIIESVQPPITTSMIQSAPRLVTTSSVPLHSPSYQNLFESRFSYNSSRFQQNQIEFLRKKIEGLRQESRGIEIFTARQQVIVAEFNSTIQTLRESTQTPINPAFNSHAAVAQIIKSWRKLSTLKFSNHTLDNELQSVIRYIQTATTDPATHEFNPIHAHVNVSKAIDKLENKLKDWNENPLNLAKQAIQDTQDYLTKYSWTPKMSADPNKIETWEFLNTSTQEACNSITECAYNKNLQRMIDLCDNGNLAEARELALKYPPGLSCMPFQSIYEASFAEKFTAENIDKRFINDPLYLTKKSELVRPNEQYLSSPHPLNSELAVRYALYKGITKELAIYNPNPETKQLIYDVISKERENLNSSISPCKTFISLAKCPINNPETAALVQTSMSYLKKGLSNTPEASAFLTVAEAQAQALAHPDSQQAILNLADYSRAPGSIHHAEIQKAAIQLIADNINASKNPAQAQRSSSVDWATIQRIDRAVQAMQNGDIRAEYYLQNGLTPKLNLQVLNVDYDEQLAHFAGINQTNIVAHVQERKDLTRVLLNNGAEFKLQSYEMLPSVEKFLVQNGIDPAKYKSCYGHQLQQAIHKNILEQVVKQHELSGLKLIESSNLSRLLSLTTQISDLSRQHNAIGDVGQAGMLSNFCWQLIDHVKQGVTGFYAPLRGTISGSRELVSNYSALISDPVGSAKRWLDNIGHLTETGFRIVYYLDDQLGALTRGTPEQSAAAIIDLQEKTRQLAGKYLDFLKHEGISGLVEQGFHHGTVLAGDTLIINKTLSVLEKFHTLAKGQIIEFAHESALKAFKDAGTIEAIASTAEGISLRAAQAAEQCALSEAQQIGSATKNAPLVGSALESVETQIINGVEKSIPTTIENLNSCNAIYEQLSRFPNQIWKKIKPTQEFWNPHSLIPKSFEIEVEGQKFWVAPNGSKHMMTLTSPITELRQDVLAISSFNIPATKTVLAHELILNDFYEAVKMVIKSGNIYETKGVLFNGWEIGINPTRTIDGLPAIIHARKI